MKVGVNKSGFKLRGESAVQDFYKIREECLEKRALFEDPEFPASYESLSKTGKADPSYKWLRPREICMQMQPKFVVDEGSRFDVNQGKLGNCWLIAAVDNLTLHKKLFLRVVCNDNSFLQDYAGIFHFRLI